MKKLAGLLLITALVTWAATSAMAVSSYKSAFLTKYPTKSATTLNSCTLCHTGSPSGSNVNSYGDDYANNNNNFTAIENMDSDGDGYSNIAEINANTWPGNASSFPAAGDTTAPVVSTFTLPATSTSLTVSISALTATDAVGVTGYMVTESSSAPAAGAAGWSGSAPASYTFAGGTANGLKTLYAWAKDAAGNVSSSRSTTVTINLPDTTAPVVSTFTLPATSTSLTVSISALTATDAVGVTGYMVTESSSAPAAGAAGWSGSVPASYTFAGGTANGLKTLYAWAKDAAGNVSSSRSATVTINLPDTTAPVVSTFTLPATSTSLTVSISALTATDAVGVTGYMVTESSSAPAAGAAGWSGSVPASYTFAGGTANGLKTLYAWAKDAAGNVSSSRSATVTINLPDTTAPVVSTFTLPATSASLTVSITSIVASDNVGVAGYLVNESATAPAASAAGWSATPPANYTFATSGNKTLYAWAKDAAGNVSLSYSASVVVNAPVAGQIAQIGVFRAGMWKMDTTTDGTWNAGDTNTPFGSSTDIPVFGDWSGIGSAQIGIFRNGSWYLDFNGDGLWSGCGAPADPTKDLCISFGLSTDIPVVGDWNGDGKTKVGVYRNGQWGLDYTGDGKWNGCGAPGDPAKDLCFSYGTSTDIPVVGDWNGNGTSKIGIVRNATWYLDYNGDGVFGACGAPADPTKIACYNFGLATDIPVVGDWNGDGKSKIGVFRNGAWGLDANGDGKWSGCSSAGGSDHCHTFGQAGDVPVVK